jgi:hypothetical protein
VTRATTPAGRNSTMSTTGQLPAPPAMPDQGEEHHDHKTNWLAIWLSITAAGVSILIAVALWKV